MRLVKGQIRKLSDKHGEVKGGSAKGDQELILGEFLGQPFPVECLIPDQRRISSVAIKADPVISPNEFVSMEWLVPGAHTWITVEKEGPTSQRYSEHKAMTEILHVSTTKPKEVVDLSDKVEAVIRELTMQKGLCSLFVTHTTAALTTGEIGEGTEQDFLQVVEQMIPHIQFRHAHNPSHAWSHMASSILGPSLTVPVSAGKLVFGTWQSIMLVELDGPREREVYVTLLSSR